MRRSTLDADIVQDELVLAVRMHFAAVRLVVSFVRGSRPDSAVHRASRASAFLTCFSSTPSAAPIARKLIPSRRILAASPAIRCH